MNQGKLSLQRKVQVLLWNKQKYKYNNYLKAKTNMNQGKSDIIAKRKVQVLLWNKQKYKYDNHMQIMLMIINDVTI